MVRSFFASPPCSEAGICVEGAKGIWWKWQRVLLKQPGLPLPGVGGLMVELAPAVWQMEQTAAFASSVLVWVEPPVFDDHGFLECGALTSLPWQEALFMQLGAVPLLKDVP
jgi:hypothetical protein